MSKDITGRDGNAGAEPDIHAREEYIFGRPERIPPLNPDEIGKDIIDSANALRRAIGLPESDNVVAFTRITLRYPALFERHTALALEFFGGALGLRDRELAILRVGWLCQAPYEWGEHVLIAKREAGLTAEEIERVTQGSAAPGWNDRDRAILRAVEELHDDAMITDETWAALVQHLNEQQLLALPLLVGQYQGVAYLQNALRVRLQANNPGLSAR